jgi:thiosulfate dehydrogenase [quinone] large subunit
MVQQLRTTVLGRDGTLELSGKLTGYWIVFLRLLVGGWFLHEGLNKYATPGAFSAGWFLEKTGTIVSPVLNALAGGTTETIITLAIPAGELLIGVGLVLGALTRTAALFGSVMMFFFYFGGEHWRRSLVNGELLGFVLFVTIIIVGAGRIWGIDAHLESTELVHDHPWLRYLLG